MNGYLFVFGASQVVLLVKNPPANAGDVRDSGSIPGSGRLPGGGHGNHSSILAWRIPMDRGAWRATVHGVAENPMQLKPLSMHTHFLFCNEDLRKSSRFIYFSYQRKQI